MAAEEISFAQFFFWNGIGGVGLGGYIWYDAYGDPTKRGRRVMGIILTRGGLACSFLAVTKINAFVLGLSIPSILGPLVVLISWSIIVYDIHLKKHAMKSVAVSRLKILAASWGNSTSRQSALKQVDSIPRDALTFFVNPDALGGLDPAPGDNNKYLEVTYSYGDEAERAVSRKQGQWITLPEDRSVKTTEPSKLAINWANYRGIEEGGEVYNVTDFLRQVVSGDSLVFDVESHNFVIGNKNFVPHDPLPFKKKRLEVNYSYAGAPARTVWRHEHDRVLLPEDSLIQWLVSELDRSKAGLSNPDPSWVASKLPTLR